MKNTFEGCPIFGAAAGHLSSSMNAEERAEFTRLQQNTNAQLGLFMGFILKLQIEIEKLQEENKKLHDILNAREL